MRIQKPFAALTSTLPIFFCFLLFASIMCVPACSSDNDNTGVQPNYIVQATISVEDDGPVAFALVMDGDENLIDTLNLTINGNPMTIEYLTDADGVSAETGDGSPYYTMDLSDLKGGDMVVFEARDQFGAIIYAPEPAVIPMAIELLEPEEGQEILAGDELLIRWTGGDGAEVFSVAYAALDGSALFSDDLLQGASGTFTVPAGQTVEGTGIVGVGAITGDISVIDTFDSEFISRESYLLITRSVGVEVPAKSAQSVLEASRICPSGDPGMASIDAIPACTGEFAALGIGAIIWENRRQAALKVCDNECCRSTTNNWEYCIQYGKMAGHASWNPHCLACFCNQNKCIASDFDPYGKWGCGWRSAEGVFPCPF